MTNSALVVPKNKNRHTSYISTTPVCLSVCPSVCLRGTNEASPLCFARSESLANVPHQSRSLDWYVRIHIEGDTITITIIITITDTITTTTAIVMITRRSLPAREPVASPQRNATKKLHRRANQSVHQETNHPFTSQGNRPHICAYIPSSSYSTKATDPEPGDFKA